VFAAPVPDTRVVVTITEATSRDLRPMSRAHTVAHDLKMSRDRTMRPITWTFPAVSIRMDRRVPITRKVEITLRPTGQAKVTAIVTERAEVTAEVTAIITRTAEVVIARAAILGTAEVTVKVTLIVGVIVSEMLTGTAEVTAIPAAEVTAIPEAEVTAIPAAEVSVIPETATEIATEILTTVIPPSPTSLNLHFFPEKLFPKIHFKLPTMLSLVYSV